MSLPRHIARPLQLPLTPLDDELLDEDELDDELELEELELDDELELELLDEPPVQLPPRLHALFQ